MLISSMLQILNQYQPQPAAADEASAAPIETPVNPEIYSVQQEEAHALAKLQLDIAAAAGLLRPLSPDPDMSPISLPGPSLEELMQIIDNLKAVEESRVVDVFE